MEKDWLHVDGERGEETVPQVVAEEEKDELYSPSSVVSLDGDDSDAFEDEIGRTSAKTKRNNKRVGRATGVITAAATRKDNTTQLGPSFTGSSTTAATAAATRVIIGDEQHDGRRRTANVTPSSSLAAKNNNARGISGGSMKKSLSSNNAEEGNDDSSLWAFPPAAPRKHRNYSSSVVNTQAIPHTHSSSSPAHQKAMAAAAAAKRRPRPINGEGSNNNTHHNHHHHQESLSVSGGFVPSHNNDEGQQQQSSLKRPIRIQNESVVLGKHNAARQYSSNNNAHSSYHGHNNNSSIPQSSSGRRKPRQQQQLPNNNKKIIISRDNKTTATADALITTMPREKTQQQQRQQNNTAIITPGTATSVVATGIAHSVLEIKKAAATGADALLIPGKTKRPVMRSQVLHPKAHHPRNSKIGTKVGGGGGAANNTKYNLKTSSTTFARPNDHGASLLVAPPAAAAKSSMSLARQDRYHQCLASKGGGTAAGGGGHNHHHHHRIVRIIRNKNDASGRGGNDDDSGSMAGVASVGGSTTASSTTTKSKSAVGAFAATPLLALGTPSSSLSFSSSFSSSLRHSRYNEVMATKGGRCPPVTATMAAGATNPQPSSSSDTTTAAASATSTGAISSSSTSDDLSIDVTVTEAASAPTDLARGSYLPTGTVQPGAVSVGDDGRDPRAAAAAAFEASVAPEIDMPTSVSSAAPPAATAAPSVDAVVAAGAQEASDHPFSVVSAHLVEESEHVDDRSIERRVDDRVNARLAEHQNNLVVADVVADNNDDNRRQQPGNGNGDNAHSPAIAGAAASPWKMLVMYCLAVLLPVALASIVVGVVVARGSAAGAMRGSGGTGASASASDTSAAQDAVSNEGTVSATKRTLAPSAQAPTEVTSEQPSADPPSAFPSELLPEDDLSDQSSSSSRGSGSVIGTPDPWLFWPPTTPPNDFPATVPPPGSLPGIIPDAPDPESPCTSGSYYGIAWDQYAQARTLWVVDGSNFSSPRQVGMAGCYLLNLAFDRSGFAFGLCSSGVSSTSWLVAVDARSGASAEIAESPEFGYVLAYNPADDHLYSVRFDDGIDSQNQTLVRIVKDFGSTFVVTPSFARNMTYLSIDSNGDAVGSDGSALYSVNLADGTSSQLLGTLPSGLGAFVLLGFRGTTLYVRGNSPAQVPLLAITVDAAGSRFTATTIANVDEVTATYLWDGAFCPL